MSVDILVVDDAAAVRRLIRAVIEEGNCGWAVTAEAADGREAIDVAQLTQPDIVLLDLSMPVMDGLQALPLVREAAPNAIVIVLTGFTGDAARGAAGAAGADGFIEKEDLVAALIPRLEANLADLRAVNEVKEKP